MMSRAESFTLKRWSFISFEVEDSCNKRKAPVHCGIAWNGINSEVARFGPCEKEGLKRNPDLAGIGL